MKTVISKIIRIYREKGINYLIKNYVFKRVSVILHRISCFSYESFKFQNKKYYYFFDQIIIYCQ